MKTSKRRLGGAVGVLAVLAVVAFQGYPGAGRNQAVSLASETAVVVTPVTSRGHIIPVQHAELAFAHDGQIAEILVVEGETVAAGTPLLRLDSSREDIALRLAQAALQQAQSSLQAALAEVAAAQVDLDAANLTIAAAETELALLSTGPVTEAVALQEAMVGVAAAEVQSAGGVQALVLAGPRPADVSAAQSALAAAQAQLFVIQQANGPIAEVDDGSVDPRVREQAQLRINAAAAAVAAAQAQYAEVLAGASGPLRQEAASAVGAAAADRRAVQAELDLLLATAPAELLAVAQAQLSAARQVAVEATIDVEQAQAAVTQAEARVQEAEIGVQEAESRLSETVLTAPLAGTVTELAVRLGDIVEPARGVITLADMSAWQIQTLDLNELDVVKVRSDDPVDVQLDAFPCEVLHGQILRIAQTAGQNRGGATFGITLALPDADLPLRWGMTAMVTIHVSGGEALP